MTIINPEFYFKPLEPDQVEMALAVAAVSAIDSIETESFGLGQNGLPKSAGTPWGLFIRGSLSGAAWLHIPPTGRAKIAALALPKKNWKRGLPSFMIMELAKTIPDRDIEITIDHGGRHLAEELEIAGFAGPDPKDEAFPAGVWVKSKI